MTDHDIAELLPFYANGTLDAADRAVTAPGPLDLPEDHLRGEAGADQYDVLVRRRVLSK